MAQQVFTNRYEIVDHLARGGMAEVYLARDLLLDRPVALKVLFPELSADHSFVERFRREAQAAANLNHPNIVSVYDWGEDDSTYFMVMEYVDGRTLRDLLRAEGHLHPNRAADIAADIAAALSFAHRNGVIHRDVKPGNVLITSSGQVKVTDFGIARAIRDGSDDNLTRTGTVMGTATYFSPEQAQGLPIDPRSDVYALGVVLYEMLIGRPPFTGDNPVAIAYQHVRETPVAPASLNPDVPPALEAIVLRALAKSPADRYNSANDLRTDLIRFREGRSVAAMATVRPPAPAPEATRVERAYADATRVTPAAAAGTTMLAPPPPRRTGAYVALLLVLLAILGALLFLLSRQFSGGGGGAKTEVVPSVVTMPVDQAIRTLQDKGFKATQQQVANDQVQPGVVFEQNPVAGAKIAKGSTVALKVSSGAPPISVPDVRNLNLADAKDKIEGAGLVLGPIVRQADDAAPKDQVLDQKPAPGTQAKKGDTVTLTVSSGKPQVTVPDVTNQDATAAANVLGQKGFNVQTTDQPSDTVPSGKVVKTDPPAGTNADKGSTVTMFVSTGPAPVSVPSVTGLTQSDATNQLTAAGFKVTVAYQTVVSPADVGRVVNQNPNASTLAPKGSTVTITVGKALS